MFLLPSGPCPAGSASTEGFTDPDTGECDPCDTGEYQDNEGSKQCLSCPGIQTNFETESTSCTPGIHVIVLWFLIVVLSIEISIT